MKFALSEGICDFALTVQAFLKRGWTFVDIDYGDHRYGRSTMLVCERNGQRITFSPDDIEAWLKEAYRREAEVPQSIDVRYDLGE